MIPWRCILCNLINQWCHMDGTVRLSCYECGA